MAQTSNVIATLIMALIVPIIAVLAQMLGIEQADAQKIPAQPWQKICAKNANGDVCNVQYQVIASTGQIVTSVNLFTVSGNINRRFFQVSVPTNRLIPAGVAVKIDTEKENRIPYANCFPDRCIAEGKLDDNLITLLKSGGEMLLTSTNYMNQPSPIKISLTGFAAAIDGPAMKPADIKENTRILQEKLRKNAEEIGRKLEEAQEKAID
ncbi:MAG: invasion associated locus B family protein [Hyphomicrobiales bacterium]|nr:invasion associated locus B family protein [Hyphomicrobiales bacterium]